MNSALSGVLLSALSTQSAMDLPQLTPEIWQWICFGLGTLSLICLALSFLLFPGLGIVALITGLFSVGTSRWRRHRKGEKNWKTVIGFWGGIPAIVVFTVTLGLILFF